MRNTENLKARKYDMADTIALLDVNSYPMVAILTNAGKDPVSKKGKSIKKVVTTDPEFKWYEDEFASREATVKSSQSINVGADNQQLELVSGDGAKFIVGDVITILKGKYNFNVKAINGDTLTLSKELGGATGTKDVSDSVVWIIGNANEEGAGLRDGNATESVEKVGYTQIFRTRIEITNTANATETLIKENDLDYQRRKKGIEHAIDIERAFLFGKKYKDLSGKAPKRFTEGIINAVKTHASANVSTEEEFELFLEQAFANGSSEKYLFASPRLLSKINSFAKQKLQTVRTDEVFGLNITKYVSPHGVLNIIPHKLLKGNPYGNYGVIVDFDALAYRYLKDRDTKLLTDRQANDADGKIDEYLTEAGLQIQQEKRHAILSVDSL